MSLVHCLLFSWFSLVTWKVLSTGGTSMDSEVIIWKGYVETFILVLSVFCIGVAKVSLGLDLIITDLVLWILYGLLMIFFFATTPPTPTSTSSPILKPTHHTSKTNYN